ncbi:MAG: hypothetical protein M3Y44_12075 [Actinomycetota bacterium]|nr:hypothetical protein [Actinomycetota bacterium]
MTSTLDELPATRDALHQVAEHVLAAAQFAQSGDVRLAHVPGGFTTYSELRGQRRVMVIDDELVVLDAIGRRVTPLTTVGTAAAFLGITAGLPPSAYPPATPLRPDARLPIDPAGAKLLARWYALADAALRTFATEVGAGPMRPTLWPEHFDLGITIDGVNYGASPGDQHVEQPYLYVGPHGGPPSKDDFWNAEFGAVLTIAEVGSRDDALAFFRRSRSRVAT